MRSNEPGERKSVISSGLPETAASIAVAATVVGAAATLLVRRTRASEATKVHVLLRQLIKMQISKGKLLLEYMNNAI